MKKQKLELTWIGKENRPRLEPRILLEQAELSHHAAQRVGEQDLFVCVCGEPAQIVRETILAAQETARVYAQEINPHHAPRVIVLNDGKVARKDNW